MQKEVIIGILITIILLLVVIWAIFVRKEKFRWKTVQQSGQNSSWEQEPVQMKVDGAELTEGNFDRSN